MLFRSKHLLKLKRDQILPFLLIAVTNGVVAPVLWFTGLAQTSAVNAELFGRTETLFLLLLSVLILHQKTNRSHLIGGSVIVFGVLIVALRGFDEALVLRFGDALIIAASLIFAIGGVFIHKYLHNVEPQVLIAVRSLIALSVFFIVSPFIEHPFIDELKTLPLTLIPVLLAFGFISRFLSIFSFYKAIERLSIPTFSLMATLTVASSTLFAHFYLGEPIHWYQALGAGLIILGAVLVHVTGLHPSEHHIKHHLKTRHR